MTDFVSPSNASKVERVAGLDSVETVLRVLLRSTGMRIALVAQVTEDSWTCCSVLDEADFGLTTGDSLDLSTTY